MPPTTRQMPGHNLPPPLLAPHWPDIDILRLDIHILRPNINILRPDIHILRPGNDILRPFIDILRPDINILRQNIDILRPKILRSIIMFKHYYALGPPAYPDIHIACT